MSHDIRTPMNALLGYNQLMKKELTNPRLLHYQEKIEQSGNLLLSIINNVLDMARIESGKMELDENYTQVEDILKEIEGYLNLRQGKRDSTLHMNCKWSIIIFFAIQRKFSRFLLILLVTRLNTHLPVELC